MTLLVLTVSQLLVSGAVQHRLSVVEENAATTIGEAIDNIGSGISEFKDDVKIGVGNQAVATDIIIKQIAASAVNIFGAKCDRKSIISKRKW